MRRGPDLGSILNLRVPEVFVLCSGMLIFGFFRYFPFSLVLWMFVPQHALLLLSDHVAATLDISLRVAG